MKEISLLTLRAPVQSRNPAFALLDADVSSCRVEFLNRHSRLPKKSCQRTNFQFTVVRNHAAGAASPHHDVTTPLAHNCESQALERMNSFGAGDARSAILMNRYVHKIDQRAEEGRPLPGVRLEITPPGALPRLPDLMPEDGANR